MPDSIILNLLFIEASHLRLTSADIDTKSSPATMRTSVAEVLGRKISEFELYAAPPGIKLPENADDESLRTALLPHDNSPPLKYLPRRRWPELFQVEDDLHLVAISRNSVRIKFYDVAKKKVRSVIASLMTLSNLSSPILRRRRQRLYTRIHKEFGAIMRSRKSKL